MSKAKTAAPAVLAERLTEAREELFNVCAILSVVQALAPVETKVTEPDWKRYATLLYERVDHVAGLLEPDVLLDPGEVQTGA